MFVHASTEGVGMSKRPGNRTEPRPRRLARALAVLAAVAAAVALWTIARFALGVDVREPRWSGPPVELEAVNVALASVVAALAGWALLAALERFTARAARWWAMIAAVIAVASSLGPLTTPGLAWSSRLVLVLLHLVVGAVLIPLLYRSSPSREWVSR